MSEYIKISDLQEFCNNQKDHCITPNDFQRMKRIELPDEHGRLVDAGKLASVYLPQHRRQCKEKGIEFNDFQVAVAISRAPTVLDATEV